MNTNPINEYANSVFIEFLGYDGEVLEADWFDASMSIEQIIEEIKIDPNLLASYSVLDTEYNASTGAYIELFGEDRLDEFEDRYQGEYNSFMEFARGYFEMVEICPDRILPFIDWDLYAQDLEHDFIYDTDDKGYVQVFSNY